MSLHDLLQESFTFTHDRLALSKGLTSAGMCPTYLLKDNVTATKQGTDWPMPFSSACVRQRIRYLCICLVSDTFPPAEQNSTIKSSEQRVPTCNSCQQLTRHDLGEGGFCRVSAVACQTHHKLLHKFSQLIVTEFWEQIQTARPSHITVYTVRLAYTVNTHFVTISCIRPIDNNPSYFTSQPARCLHKQLRAQFKKPTYLLHRFVIQHIYYYYYYCYFYICDASFT
jgi:hypothetical protein